MTEPILRVEDLWLQRTQSDILQGVNLEIYPGQVHVLLGLNGSGKSTLAYTIMGCEGYVPDSGRILFDGHDLAGLSVTERAKLGITLAWQEPARFEGIPIGKYVGLGKDKASKDYVSSMLEAVSLPAKYYGYRAADATLSGGERKRVELAAVYAMKPKLAILDEPDSGIDVLTVGDIGMLIRRMALEGTAVLLITHNDGIVEMADAASLMCAGAVVFTGKPHETRRYFSTRCMPHIESFGSQPWDINQPEVQAALASNGVRRFLSLKEESND